MKNKKTTVRKHKRQPTITVPGSNTVAHRDAESPFISFFSGALGLDIGLESAGLRSLAVNDVDPVACKTIRQNRPHLKLFDFDLRRLSAEQLLKDLGVEREELFAIVGGPPCQAFSTAGRRLGLNDDRGNVFLHFVKLIAGLRPKYVIFENVRGLLSAPLVHRPHEQRGRGFDALTQDEKPGGALLHILGLLEEAGYSTTFTLYNTANFGVPQIRERLIFFSSRDGKKIPFMCPTHDELGSNGLPKWKSLREAIAHLQGAKLNAGKFPESRLKYYRMLREGQNWRSLPPDIQKEAMGASWYAGGGKTGFYRRLAWDKPAPTLVTSPTMPATDLCHPEQLRPLSVEEYAAIQTFPPDYEFCGRLDDQYRQIGNAVPCKFGKAIATHILAFDRGTLSQANSNGKMSRYVGTDHESWRRSVLASEQSEFCFTAPESA
jgi:DNA (cytosine-5)-methyltransferase 1